MKWTLIFIALAGACIAQDTRSVSVKESAYELPIVRITNSNDFQWSLVDTVLAVYYEPKHTTVLMQNGKAKEWYPPFVVEEINRKD